MKIADSLNEAAQNTTMRNVETLAETHMDKSSSQIRIFFYIILMKAKYVSAFS